MLMSIIFVDTTTGGILESVRIIETEPKQIRRSWQDGDYHLCR